MKPILFNTEMVKAILDGRKTVTRRLVKLPSYVKLEEDGTYTLYAEGTAYGKQCMEQLVPYLRKPCEPGDILYVRETYANISDFVNYAEYELDSDLKYLYKCDDNGKEHSFIDVGVKRWRPSIHMPKEAARIFLKVIDLRVERLQGITITDIDREGFSCGHSIDETWYERGIKDFSELWNSTIPKKDPSDMYKYGWKANPWVWVIEFERISKEESYESNN